MTIRVLAADDHGAIRAGLMLMLGSDPDIEVVGEAADGEAATRRISAEGLANVLVLTTFDLDEYVHAALRAGAAGFLLKSVEARHLVEAVKLVASGDGVLAPTVTRRLISAFAATSGEAPVPPNGLDDLTEREREVFGCLGSGMSNAQISSRLHIGETTVKTHVSRVLTKLGVRSRGQAAILAQEYGLVVD
ncbi:MAG TPA: response regulator transcription factor [Pseudonocardiaceae bacterium]